MKTDKALNLQHILLQAIYCLVGIFIYTYASNFLLYKGYTNTQIGVILSISSLSSILAQPLIANFTDKSKKLSVVEIMLIFFVIGSLLCVLLYVVGKACLPLSILFICTYCVYDSMSPLLSTIAYKIEEVGVKSDYGFARAFGSISFAVFNMFMGHIINAFTPNAISLVGLFSGLLMVLTLVWMSVTFKKCKIVDDKKDKQNEISMKEFITNNMSMLWLFFAIALILVSSNITNYYLFQIITPLGGTVVDQGYLALLWALVEVPGMMLFSKLNNKFSIEALLIFSAIIYTVKALGMFVANNMALVYFALSFQWGSFAIMQPGIVKYINTNTRPEEKARGQALKTTICCVGSIISSLIGGFVIDNFGVKSLLGFSLTTCIIGTLLFAYVITQRKKED